MLCLFPFSGVQHILCCVCFRLVGSNTYYLCLFPFSGVQHILCCVCFRLVGSNTYYVLFFFCLSPTMVLVFHDCPFLIDPSIISKVYLIRAMMVDTRI